MHTPRVCSCCGKELDFFDLQQNFSIHKPVIGYGSVYDGDSVDLTLCCCCFDALVQKCRISPIHSISEVNILQ